MRLPKDILTRPVEQGARMLALHFLEEAGNAAPRTLDKSDPEGLHAFRVGIRRLRSVVRAYAPWLKSSVRKKTARALKRIASDTNAGRDAEVLVTWLEKQRPHLPRQHRKALSHLRDALEARREDAYLEVAADVVPSFSAIVDSLHEKLETYSLVLNVGQVHSITTFGHVLADVLGAEIKDFRADLTHLTDVSQIEQAHKTRISGKRIRYLIEPLQSHIPGAPECVAALKVLQNQLGELHDMHVLAEEIAHAQREGDSLAYAHLAEHVQTHSSQIFARTKRRFLGNRTSELTGSLERLVHVLRNPARENVEIERKFLLTEFPPRAREGVSKKIIQGYLPGERLIERVRKVTSAKETRYFRTIKVGSGIERMELEEETTSEIFEALWALTVGKRVEKTRYVVKEGNRSWEIDDFTDRTLVLAEVELSHADEKAPIPSWLAPFVVREVTSESEYVNARLAK